MANLEARLAQLENQYGGLLNDLRTFELKVTGDLGQLVDKMNMVDAVFTKYQDQATVHETVTASMMDPMRAMVDEVKSLSGKQSDLTQGVKTEIANRVADMDSKFKLMQGK